MRAMECLVTAVDCSDGRRIMVLTETSDNPGPSITNCADLLLPALYREMGDEARAVRFVEHYRDDVSYRSQGSRETFDELVHRGEPDGSIVFLGWKRLWEKS